MRIGAEVRAAIEARSELAPLHNPVALRWIDAARRLCLQALQVTAYDMASFAELPAAPHARLMRCTALPLRQSN
jgi:acetate kinase